MFGVKGKQMRTRKIVVIGLCLLVTSVAAIAGDDDCAGELKRLRKAFDAAHAERAHLAGELNAARKRIEELEDELEHCDRSLKATTQRTTNLPTNQQPRWKLNPDGWSRCSAAIEHTNGWLGVIASREDGDRGTKLIIRSDAFDPPAWLHAILKESEDVGRLTVGDKVLVMGNVESIDIGTNIFGDMKIRVDLQNTVILDAFGRR